MAISRSLKTAAKGAMGLFHEVDEQRPLKINANAGAEMSSETRNTELSGGNQQKS
ncbi:hypothetical protein QT332_07330 [Escherichia coli]|nr:hypothetical protein [Escherichia coli]MDM4917942.1 hypothetical protein [Escherichia coli]